MGDIPTDRPPTRTRIPAPAKDLRPGLPVPAPRAMQPRWDTGSNYPQPETGNTVLSGGPGRVEIPQHPVDRAKYAATGQTPTITGGFNTASPSGTGLADQVSGYVPVKTPGNSDKRVQPRR